MSDLYVTYLYDHERLRSVVSGGDDIIQLVGEARSRSVEVGRPILAHYIRPAGSDGDAPGLSVLVNGPMHMGVVVYHERRSDSSGDTWETSGKGDPGAVVTYVWQAGNYHVRVNSSAEINVTVVPDIIAAFGDNPEQRPSFCQWHPAGSTTDEQDDVVDTDHGQLAQQLRALGPIPRAS